MKTKGELVSDLELRFTEGHPSDDLELERDQIAHWLDIASNSVLADQLSKQIRRGEDINPFYIIPSSYKTAAEEALADVINADERYFIDISDIDILPIRGHDRDYGVVRVHDDTNKQLVAISYDDSDFYKNLKFAAPCTDNMQWYREGEKIYIDGVDVTNVNSFKFRVFYVPQIDTSALADSSDYPLGDELLSIVSDMAEEIGWRQLREKSINDILNDGKQR